MKSPFKFLDSYTKSDKDIFFGRDREVKELYQKVFESKLLLLYGVSGTGKTSIIQCGLANKFLESDWLQLNIRRGEDINESFIAEIRKELSNSDSSTSSLKKAVKDLYLDNFKPIYFIFDQFEELFIFGSDEEREQFVRSIRELLDSDLQCRFVFSIREEYLANLTEFESIIPELFANRVRIERMNIQQAKAVIEGSCSYAGISLESGFAEKLLDNIVTYTKQVELTYLQVYLDRLYNKIIANNLLEHFSLELLNSLDNVKDLLGGFLDDQINQFQDSDIVLTILKSFVSSRGTKKQITIEEVQEFGKSIGKELGQDSLQQIIQSLVEIRILQDKNESNKYELRHDALAAKVYEKISIAEKELIEVRSHVLNAYSNYERRGVLLTKEDLQYIAPYEDKLYLNSEEKEFIERSQNEESKQRRRRRSIWIIITIVVLFTLVGFSWWALNERNKAEIESNRANALYYSELAQKVFEDKPEVALRLAEYAYSLDTTNRVVFQILLNIYAENPVLKRKIKNVGVVGFSEDHSLIVFNQNDSVKIINNSLECVSAFLYNSSVSELDINSKSKNVIIVDKENVIVYSKTGKFISTLIDDASVNTFRDHVKISQNGEYILLGYDEGYGLMNKIKLFSDNDSVQDLLRVHEYLNDTKVHSYGFSSNNQEYFIVEQMLKNGGAKYVINVYGINSGQKIFTSNYYNNPVSVGLNDNDLTIDCVLSNSLEKISLISGESTKMYRENEGQYILSSNDNNYLLHRTNSSNIQICNNLGRSISTIKLNKGEEGVSLGFAEKAIISSCKKYVYVQGYNNVYIYYLQIHETEIELPENFEINRFKFNQSTNTIYYSKFGSNYVHVFSLETLKKDSIRIYGDKYTSFDISPDGTNILIYGNELELLSGINIARSNTSISTLRLYDLVLRETRFCLPLEHGDMYVHFTDFEPLICLNSLKGAIFIDYSADTIYRFKIDNNYIVQKSSFNRKQNQIYSIVYKLEDQILFQQGVLVMDIESDSTYFLERLHWMDQVSLLPDKTVSVINGYLTFVNSLDKIDQSWQVSDNNYNTIIYNNDRNQGVLYDIYTNNGFLVINNMGLITSRSNAITYRVDFYGDDKLVYFTFNNSVRLIRQKEDYKDFKRNNNYYELSSVEKIKYYNLKVEDVFDQVKDDELIEVGSYILNKSKSLSKDDAIKHLELVLKLFDRIDGKAKFKNSADIYFRSIVDLHFLQCEDFNNKILEDFIGRLKRNLPHEEYISHLVYIIEFFDVTKNDLFEDCLSYAKNDFKEYVANIEIENELKTGLNQLTILLIKMEFNDSLDLTRLNSYVNFGLSLDSSNIENYFPFQVVTALISEDYALVDKVLKHHELNGTLTGKSKEKIKKMYCNLDDSFRLKDFDIQLYLDNYSTKAEQKNTKWIKHSNVIYTQ
jgi:hypothetical protein